MARSVILHESWGHSGPQFPSVPTALMLCEERHGIHLLVPHPFSVLAGGAPRGTSALPLQLYHLGAFCAPEGLPHGQGLAGLASFRSCLGGAVVQPELKVTELGGL